MNSRIKQPQRAAATVQVVAAALYAASVNGESIRKWSDPERKLFSNRDLMEQRLLLPFTEEELAQAQELIDEYSKHVVYKRLKTKAGAPNMFETNVLEYISHPTIPLNRYGAIAHLPGMVETIRRRTQIDSYNANFELASQWSDLNIGEKVTINLTVLDVIKVNSNNQMGTWWRVYGHAEDNKLYMFNTSKKEFTESGRYTGRLKQKITIDHRNYAKVNTLNYVKKVTKKED